MRSPGRANRFGFGRASSAEAISASRITALASFGSAACIIVHHAAQQVRIEATPVHADAHRLAVSACAFDHGRELFARRERTDVAGLMRYLSRACAQSGC